jgi:hypothetical protein
MRYVLPGTSGTEEIIWAELKNKKDLRLYTLTASLIARNARQEIGTSLRGL